MIKPNLAAPKTIRLFSDEADIRVGGVQDSDGALRLMEDISRRSKH